MFNFNFSKRVRFQKRRGEGALQNWEQWEHCWGASNQVLTAETLSWIYTMLKWSLIDRTLISFSNCYFYVLSTTFIKSSNYRRKKALDWIKQNLPSTTTIRSDYSFERPNGRCEIFSFSNCYFHVLSSTFRKRAKTEWSPLSSICFLSLSRTLMPKRQFIAMRHLVKSSGY